MRPLNKALLSRLDALAIVASLSLATWTAEAQDTLLGKSEEAATALRPVEGILEGCGLVQHGGLAEIEYGIKDQSIFASEDGRFPCPGLTGGWAGFARPPRPAAWVPNAWAVCTRSFIIKYDLLGSWQRQPVLFGTAVDRDVAWRIDGKVLGACTVSSCDYEGKFQCFPVPWKTAHCYTLNLIKERRPTALPADGFPAYCKPKIHFVQAKAPYDGVESLPFGASFRVRLAFEVIPGYTSKQITIRDDSSGKAVKVTARVTEDLKVFLTEPIESPLE